MMPAIDPAWAGKVEFYELLFGTWTVYVFLVLMWEKILRERLDEWRYAMITFLGAGAFWVNHYFQYAPFWLILINLYTLMFIAAYWMLAIRGKPRGTGWKVAALLSSIVFTVAFIGFEQLARAGVERLGMHEFCWMFLTYGGFVGLIWWRGRAAKALQTA
ncbi:MAG: hypothetical protein SFV19_06300 [Rhodospirillaceae bacterium]|nr:hypothetical protein [Rhodospirillaceae bacterium]